MTPDGFLSYLSRMGVIHPYGVYQETGFETAPVTTSQVSDPVFPENKIPEF